MMLLPRRSVDEPQSGIPGPSFHIDALISQLCLHLSSDDLAYFNHWITCVFLESSEVTKKDKQQRFWMKAAEERYFLILI